MADTFLFRVHRSQILPALNAVFEAVDPRSNIPILQNVLLSPNADRLRLSGTNMTVEVETSCDLLESASGNPLTLSGKALLDIVKSLSEVAEIEFAFDDLRGQIRVKSGRSKFLLSTLRADQFPTIASLASGKSVTVDMPSLISAIARVKYALFDHKDRAYLSGIFIHPEEGENKIAVVAADGHNLAVVRFPCEADTTFPGAIIPIKAIDAIRRLFGETKASAQVKISDEMIQISCHDVRLTSKLIDAVYPDYDVAIPKNNTSRIVVDAKHLIDAVRRVCLVKKDDKRDTVKLVGSKGVLQVSMAATDGEEAVEEIAAEYNGPQIRIGFNGDYLKDALSSIKTTEVAISLLTESSPGLLTPTVGTDELYVVYPRVLAHD
ncbi:DNA polymerase III subunit beta [Agrobacterium vitis]|uniref:DNA polymerase III subunit beta n=1 Tax=Agrobacterium vitis TaxID=373 RepID=UPI0008DC141B|nr:DNA polymerase III subunit beta [Agrobacterium vitis]